jgi:Na+(H+)/acetate symporter ActP
MSGGRVVFDITKSVPFMGSHILVGLTVMIVVGLGAVVATSYRPRAFVLIWTTALVSIALLVTLGFGFGWLNLRSKAESGVTAVVEGCITRFHPSSGQRGDDEEMIEVSGQRFVYSDDEVTPAFHRTVSQDGPLRPDTWARITHVGNEITKLEVVGHACPTAPTDASWRAD